MTSRRIAIFFLFLLCMCLSQLATQLHAQNTSANDRDRFEYVAGTGLEIHTNPQGAKVFIDGIERGVTPFINHDLPAKTYLIELRRETYTERRFNAVVLSNSRLFVTMEMEAAFGLVDVTVRQEENSSSSVPFNPLLATKFPAQISARGIELNSISLSQDTVTVKLPIGNRTIHARAFGWEDASVNVLVSGQEKTTVEITMKPAVFKLSKAVQSRKRFNPANSGSLGMTEYRFEVTAPGTGVLKIIDSNDNIVYIKQLEQFDTTVQKITWDGTDSDGNKLPAARYVVLIEALPLADEDAEASVLKFITEIRYSILKKR